ncbi:MAG: oligosaccharide flippase family protein [Pseudomonadota bacterium]
MANETTGPKKSIYYHMVRGSAWSMAMRWGIRAIGLISTLILVRLLTPFDFGIAAMGGLALGFVTIFADFNIGMIVIRKVDATREDYDTGWTVRLIQSLFLASLMLAAAPLAADYFETDLARAVVMWFALTAAIGGLENIGIVKARKELDFALEFRFVLYKRVFEFLFTVGFAFWLRDYWALVFGPMSAAILGVLISYRMHPYRPRLSLAKWREFLKFSIWLTLRNFSRYFNMRLHLLLVGRAESTAFFGIYNVAAGLAQIATQEIGTPLARGLYPNFAKLVDKPDELMRAFSHSLCALGLLCLPAGIGLACVAELFVPVVYGAQWVDAVPFVKWLAVYSVLNVIFIHVYGGILVVTGHDRLATGLSYFRLAVGAPIIIAALYWYGATAVPIATALVPAILLLPYTLVLGRVLPFTLGDLVAALWRPVIAVAAMSLAVLALDVPSLGPVLLLLAKIVLGGLVYVSCIVILWRLAGRPEGPEGYVINRGWQHMKRRLGR